ncbi:rRNA maturation RNase YbeY [Candidatus Kaiserbacteria bacterium]|nr:rRNA maturation RNase YbeY [Candidatus Kaiserbacteria bacterium]
MAGVAIKNLTRRPTAPRATFSAIAKEVLPVWDVSLVFVGPAKARALNKQLRRKDYVPNVLSYAVGDKNGEIIICPSIATRQAPNYQLSTINYILLLFIHGLLHIKGWAHSGTMERCERMLLAKFAKGVAHPLHETTHRNRH